MLKPFRVTVLISSIYRDHYKRTVVTEHAKSSKAAQRSVKARAELFGPCYVVGVEQCAA